METLTTFLDFARAVLFILAFLVADHGPNFAQNVDAVEWLPKEAENITYWEREGLGAIRIAEFKITHKHFIEWCDEKGWELTSKNNVRARRPPAEGQTQGESTIVSNALVFDKREKNGAGLTLIFDIESEIAYYSWSNR
jgi:hypothetical protein